MNLASVLSWETLVWAEKKTPRAVSPQKKVGRQKTEDRCLHSLGEYNSDDEVSNRVSNPEIKKD
jgi:hypothetical protein